MTDTHLLIRAVRAPESLGALAPEDWDLLLRQARRATLHGRLGCDERVPRERLPARIRRRLEADRTLAIYNARVVRFEIDRIGQALAGLDAPVMLLKGGAYHAAGLANARGRLVNDVDIMVPREALEAAERALVAHGWEAMTLEPYDQRYYRTWMHELPPLQHAERGTVVDVHHTILPPTARLHPDPGLIWRAARPLVGPFLAPAPSDLVLHCAVHLFYDGDLALAFRDLVDLDGLMRHFAPEPGFWDGLVGRAEALDLARPLFYALRYCRRLLDTPVPEAVVAAAAPHAPPAPALAAMDALAPRALLPDHPDAPRRGTGLALLLLYVRSHWLRMPPPLLAAHLGRKALARLSPDPAKQAAAR